MYLILVRLFFRANSSPPGRPDVPEENAFQSENVDEVAQETMDRNLESNGENTEQVGNNNNERAAPTLLPRTGTNENRENTNPSPTTIPNLDDFLRLQLEQLGQKIENQNSQMKANAVSIVASVAKILTNIDENRRQVKRAILQTLENIADRVD